MDSKVYLKGTFENVDKLTKLSDIKKAFEELSVEEVTHFVLRTVLFIILALVLCKS